MKDWEGVREEVSVLAGGFMFFCCLLRAVVTVVMTLLLVPLSAKKHALAQTKKLYSIQNERNNCVQIVLRVPYFPLITCTSTPLCNQKCLEITFLCVRHTTNFSVTNSPDFKQYHQCTRLTVNGKWCVSRLCSFYLFALRLTISIL